MYTGFIFTRWVPCSRLYIVEVVWYGCEVRMKRRGGVADWSGGVLPGNLEMGKVHASTYFSHGPSRSSGPPGSPEPPEPSGSPEPSGHPDPDSLQLELVLPQRYSTGAYGSIEATNFKVLLKNTWPFLIVEVGKERRKVFSW